MRGKNSTKVKRGGGQAGGREESKDTGERVMVTQGAR